MRHTLRSAVHNQEWTILYQFRIDSENVRSQGRGSDSGRLTDVNEAVRVGHVTVSQNSYDQVQASHHPGGSHCQHVRLVMIRRALAYRIVTIVSGVPIEGKARL